MQQLGTEEFQVQLLPLRAEMYKTRWKEHVSKIQNEKTPYRNITSYTEERNVTRPED